MYRLPLFGDGLNPRQTLLITAASYFLFGFLKTRGTRLDRLAPGASSFGLCGVGWSIGVPIRKVKRFTDNFYRCAEFF